MHTKVCEKCDREMRYIPAGISKTKNKPYSAFWSCDTRSGGCGNTARAEGDDAMPAPMGMPAADGGSSDRLAALEEKIDRLIAMVKELKQ